MPYCAPARVGSGSCFTPAALKKVVLAYNRQPLVRGGSLSEISPELPAGELWRALNQQLTKCQSVGEGCWLEQDWARELRGDNELVGAVRPKRPAGGRNPWLSTTDIHDVMVQYQKVYPRFSFLGPVPINFSELSDTLVDAVNRINLDTLKGIDCIGIIFNLSPWHPGDQGVSGSHWVALWIDKIRHRMAYFDSFGCEAGTLEACVPGEILALTQRLIARHPQYRVTFNQVRHQRSTTECGVYSMYFILECLKGRDPEEFNNPRKVITDAAVNKYRDVFFRP